MEFIAHLDALPEMMHYICLEGASLAIDKKLVRKMELACEEVVVNIISYAYPDREGRLSINCSLVSNHFEVVIKDQGKPFNPIDEEIDPQFEVPLEERKVGGLGIYLVRQIIDEVDYQREGDANILRLALKL